MKLICSLILIISLTVGLKNKPKTVAKANVYGIVGYGKPLCPVKNCRYFSSWSDQGITACYRHSIDDYSEKDSLLLKPFIKEMTFGY